MGNRAASNPKDVIRESSIQRAIRGMGTGIRVTVHGKIAFVSGTVDDYSTKREIYSIVQDSAGIEKVVNHLRVMPG